MYIDPILKKKIKYAAGQILVILILVQYEISANFLIYFSLSQDSMTFP